VTAILSEKSFSSQDSKKTIDNSITKYQRTIVHAKADLRTVVLVFGFAMFIFNFTLDTATFSISEIFFSSAPGCSPLDHCKQTTNGMKDRVAKFKVQGINS